MLPNNLQILAYRDCDLLKVKYWEIVYWLILSVKYTSSIYAHMFIERLLLVLSTYVLPNNLQF